MKNDELSGTQKIAIAVNVVIRVVLPLWVFVNPYLGAVIALITDCIDYQPLVNYFGVSRKVYELQDKYLDFYWYILIAVYVLSGPYLLVVKILIAFFLLLRLVGMIFFSVSKNETLLMYFPNYIEPLFWLLLIFPDAYTKVSSMLIAFLVIILVKTVQEYVVHKLEFSPIDWFLGLFHQDKV
jgi:hypothetical protein